MTNKILIVENEMETTGLFCEIFQGLDDYEVCYVVDGYKALVSAGVFKPDVVLLDIQLPDLDGYEVCRLIKTNPLLSGTRVLMISGLEHDPLCYQSQDAGADDCISKPFISWVLLEKIERLLEIDGRRS